MGWIVLSAVPCPPPGLLQALHFLALGMAVLPLAVIMPVSHSQFTAGTGPGAGESSWAVA